MVQSFDSTHSHICSVWISPAQEICSLSHIEWISSPIAIARLQNQLLDVKDGVTQAKGLPGSQRVEEQVLDGKTGRVEPCNNLFDGQG